MLLFFSLPFYDRRSCTLTLEPILASLISQRFSVVVVLPEPCATSAEVCAKQHCEDCQTPTQRVHCSTSSARL